MQEIKFVHASDLHLDTPFSGLSVFNKDLAEVLKEATFRSFRRVTDICIEENADFLIISGDIFDGENRSLAAQLRFIRELKRLDAERIPCYFVCGNHDPLDSWIPSLKLPENAHRFGSERVDKFRFEKEGAHLADIYGISYRTADVTENLASAFPEVNDMSVISVAVLHGNLGNQSAHGPYSPFSIGDIERKNYDYWALGHIHKRSVIRESDPAIVYPGNPQGRDFGEKGERGCYVVKFSGAHAPDIRFVPTHSVSFDEIDIDISGLGSIDEIMGRITESCSPTDRVTEHTGIIMRVRLTGSTPLHRQLNRQGEAEQLRDYFNDEHAGRSPFNRIDSIIPDTIPDIDIDSIRSSDGFASDMVSLFDEYMENEEMLSALIKEIESEMGNAAVVREKGEFTSEEKQQIMDRARWMLLEQLHREPE